MGIVSFLAHHQCGGCGGGDYCHRSFVHAQNWTNRLDGQVWPKRNRCHSHSLSSLHSFSEMMTFEEETSDEVFTKGNGPCQFRQGLCNVLKGARECRVVSG